MANNYDHSTMTAHRWCTSFLQDVRCSSVQLLAGLCVADFPGYSIIHPTSSTMCTIILSFLQSLHPRLFTATDDMGVHIWSLLCLRQYCLSLDSLDMINHHSFCSRTLIYV